MHTKPGIAARDKAVVVVVEGGGTGLGDEGRQAAHVGVAGALSPLCRIQRRHGPSCAVLQVACQWPAARQAGALSPPSHPSTCARLQPSSSAIGFKRSTKSS